MSYSLVNTLAPGWIRGFSEKKTLKSTWLCVGISLLLYGYGPGRSVKKCGKSSSLYSKKNFFAWGCWFFVSDVISRGLLGHLGLLCRALGTNR